MTEWEEKLTQIQEKIKRENIDKEDLRYAYADLYDIVLAQPDLTPHVLETFQTGLQNEKNGQSSLHFCYETLGNIAQAQPNFAPQMLETFKIGLQNKHNNNSNLATAFHYLDNIVKARPDLASQVFETIKTGLQNENNSSVPLKLAYRALENIVKAQPDLAPQVLETVKNELLGDKNGVSSLEKVHDTLNNIVKAQPDLAPQVFETVNLALHSGASLSSAYETLGNIAQAQPDLAPKVVESILVPKSQMSAYENAGKMFALSRCMRRCKPEDFADYLAKDEAAAAKMQMLQAAQRMRNSTMDDIQFACENYQIAKLAENPILFSQQQHCMNILLSQLGKENGEDKNAHQKYRKAPEQDKCYQDNKDWLVAASFKAAQTFGCNFPSYMRQTEKYLSTHDAVYWLPEELPKDKKESFCSFVSRNLIYQGEQGKKQSRPLAEMEIIAKTWKYLNPEQEKQKYKDILAVCQSRKYKDQECNKFATEAAKWGVAEEVYKDYESVYQAGLKVPEPFDSSKEFKFGKYTGRFLPRDDVRTGFFGGYTDCCQHFNGAGSACAVSTVKDPYSQLFVIENEKGRIIAGSWVWENTEGKYRDACFDNIEAIGEYAKNPLVNKIYEKVGDYLLKEKNCRKVTIGLGYQDADVSNYKETKAIPLPHQYNNKYSDAKGTQVLLCENNKATPLDKAQESQRFVRDVCYLDFDGMAMVSEQCFPEGDQALQSPDRLQGLALIDADKGIVGYCLYDKEEKSIYDMAVLPEYRKDKNASSKRLFGELIRRIREIGGEWSAELRDKTTYRYLDVMSQRGLVTFENNRIDHEMSDGSKVYSVSFKVKPVSETKQQPTTAKIKTNSAER